MMYRLASQAPWWTPRTLQPEASNAGVQDRGRDRRHNTRWGWLIIGLLTTLSLVWIAYRWVVQPDWFAALRPERQQFIALLETAGLATLAVVWAGLWLNAQRESAQGATSPDPTTLAELFALDPTGFERYVGRLFETKGYRVRRRGGSGDLGVDLELADRMGRRAIVQCKRYQNTVGSDVVRELYGTLVHEGVNHAFLVTTADISAAARDWAAGKPLTLIDGPTLVAIATNLV